ncbi:MAG: enoyl-CoA hydratase-related protein [Azoarcus sp.]|nr:enoyl-CoA hydratase-related protein [Azoarcus sp.]
MTEDAQATLLSVRREEGVVFLTIACPATRNAIDLALAVALYRAVQAVESDPGVRVVVLRSSGAHFMAGGDVHRFGALLEGEPGVAHAEFDALLTTVHALVAALGRLPCPVLGLVRGTVAGFGWSLAMACDLLIAAADTRFMFAYGALGATPDGGASWHLPRTLGMQRALAMALLNTAMDAPAALAAGLVTEVVAADQLDECGMRTARQLARGPAFAQAQTKAMLRAAFDVDLASAMAREQATFAEAARTADFAEGVRAFLERRTPCFGDGAGGAVKPDVKGEMTRARNEF